MEHFRIVKIAEVRTLSDGGVIEYDVRHILEKKYWFGWAMPFWFRLERAGYDSLSDVQTILKMYLKERGSKTRRETSIIEEITV